MQGDGSGQQKVGCGISVPLLGARLRGGRRMDLPLSLVSGTVVLGLGIGDRRSRLCGLRGRESLGMDWFGYCHAAVGLMPQVYGYFAFSS